MLKDSQIHLVATLEDLCLIEEMMKEQKLGFKENSFGVKIIYNYINLCSKEEK